MIAYFDSSALVKRLIEERTTAETLAFTAQASALITAAISRAEVAAALAMAVRQGRITQDVGGRAQAQFRADWTGIIRIRVDDALLENAETLVWRHGLRGYDGVQLAAAVRARAAARSAMVLATFDQKLWHAARAQGFPVWPRENQL